MFRGCNRRGVLISLLARLEAHKEDFDLAHAPALLTALFDVGDELPCADLSFGVGAEWSALRIVHWYLMREPDQAVRGRILKDAARASTGLFLPIMETSGESDRDQSQKDPASFAIAEDDLAELLRICVEKIRSAAQGDVLRRHPKMAFILFRWKEWAGDAEPKAWVESLVSTAEGAVRFLVGMAGPVSSYGMGDHVASTSWQVRLSDVEAFVAPEAVAARIENLDWGKLSEKEREAVQAFWRAMERRARGKGDRGPLATDDDDE
jgi:hypothetical protein